MKSGGLLISAFLLAFVVSIIPTTLAAPTSNPWNVSCINGVEYDLLCNGLCSNPGAVVVNHTIVCQNGCNNQTNSCDTPYNVPTDFFTLTVIGLLIIAAMFLVVAIKFPDDWGVVKTLFFISAMIVIVAAVGVMGSFFMAGQNSVSNVINAIYLACTLILIMFIAYIFLRWILAFVIKYLKDIESKKRRL